jgi:uncharacterized membrane protein YedE/YeeE
LSKEIGMQNFLPWHGLIGGMLIGLSGALFLILSGRMSGISGILENALQPTGSSFSWSIAYLAGLPLGAFVVGGLVPGVVPKTIAMVGSIPVLVAAGLLVGFGARLSGGCTSGHGVCGLPRFSIRSIIAVGTFMATAALTVFVMRRVLGLG